MAKADVGSEREIWGSAWCPAQCPVYESHCRRHCGAERPSWMEKEVGDGPAFQIWISVTYPNHVLTIYPGPIVQASSVYGTVQCSMHINGTDPTSIISLCRKYLLFARLSNHKAITRQIMYSTR